MIRYILFDLDGTLTDSAPGIINSLVYALDRLHTPYESTESLRKFVGPPLVDMMMQEFGFSKETALEGLRLYREYFDDRGIFENSVYPGIETMLQKLQKAGYKILLATSKPEVAARRILAHFGLERYFTFAGGSDLLETRSTKDAVIAYVLETVGITDVSECIMVGDREYDVLGAKAFGMHCIGVLYGYGSETELKNAGAARIAKDVDELTEILLQL